MKISVSTDEYTEVKQVGSRYIVHLEGVPSGDSTTVCYECMTDEEPDITILTEELAEYKAYISSLELQNAKDSKIRELMEYDSSSAVNSFEIRRHGVKLIDYWIPRDLRTSLEGDVTAAAKIGDTYKFDIREMGITLTLNCNKFLEALSTLRIYAVECFNQTSAHLAAIKLLPVLEDVEGYDFTIGYPDKLVFNIDELV